MVSLLTAGKSLAIIFLLSIFFSTILAEEEITFNESPSGEEPQLPALEQEIWGSPSVSLNDTAEANADSSFNEPITSLEIEDETLLSDSVIVSEGGEGVDTGLSPSANQVNPSAVREDNSPNDASTEADRVPIEDSQDEEVEVLIILNSQPPYRIASEVFSANGKEIENEEKKIRAMLKKYQSEKINDKVPNKISEVAFSAPSKSISIQETSFAEDDLAKISEYARSIEQVNDRSEEHTS